MPSKTKTKPPALAVQAINSIVLAHHSFFGESGPTCAVCVSLDLVDPVPYPCPTNKLANVALQALGLEAKS